MLKVNDDGRRTTRDHNSALEPSALDTGSGNTIWGAIILRLSVWSRSG